MNKLQLNTLGYRQKQQGFTLIMALAFMVFLTLIVLSMVNITSSDEKIARNTRDKDIAFAAAEAAMRDAEMYVTGSYQFPYSPPLPIVFNNQCPNALCDFGDPNTPINLEQIDFYSNDPIGRNSMKIGTVTQSPTIAGVTPDDQPRYMIELVTRNEPPNCHQFRIRCRVEGYHLTPGLLCRNCITRLVYVRQVDPGNWGFPDRYGFLLLIFS